MKKTIDDILEAIERAGYTSALDHVCQRFHVDRREVVGRGRAGFLGRARCEFYVLLTHTFGLSAPAAANLLRRHYSTILYASNKRSDELAVEHGARRARMSAADALAKANGRASEIAHAGRAA